MSSAVVLTWGLASCGGGIPERGPAQTPRASNLPLSVITPNVTISATAVDSVSPRGERSVRDLQVDATPQDAPHTTDCPTVPVTPSDASRVANAGGIAVRVKVPQLPEPLYGVLALCAMDESARGPASRAYRIQVPDEYVTATDDGRATVVYEEVETSSSGHTSWQLYLSRVPFPGVEGTAPVLGGAATK